MPTPIMQVLTQYCSIYVDDYRLNDLAVSDPALYARRMWGYLCPAIAMFTIPKEMPEYLQVVEPQYDSAVYIAAAGQTVIALNSIFDTSLDVDNTSGELIASYPNTDPATQFGLDQNTLTASTYNFASQPDITLNDGAVMATAADYAQYDICSCRIRTYDDLGNVVLTPLAVSYDSASGTVTLPQSFDEDTELEFDFYKDGYFVNALSPRAMDVLASAFEYVWTIRLSETALDRLPKVEDKSFFTQNVANKQNSDSARNREVYERFRNKMQRYEQACYMAKALPNVGVTIV